MSKLFQPIFDQFGLPFFEDSVGDIPTEFRPKDSNKSIAHRPDTQSLSEWVKTITFVDFKFRESDESLYYGNFNLEENPQSIVEITNNRLKILEELIKELEYEAQREDDTQIKNGLSQAINKAKNKRHKSFNEFSEPFKQSYLSDINLKISEYEKQERQREREHNQQQKNVHSSNLKPFNEAYTNDIEIQRNIIRERENHITTYPKTPEGYLSYLKANISKDAYSFFFKRATGKNPNSGAKETLLPCS